MRTVCLDEFGRVVAVDDYEAMTAAGVSVPVARRIAEMLREARAGLDPDKRYAEDPRWRFELELTLGEYLAGGLGGLEGDPDLRGLLDELEGFYTDAGEGAAPPEGLVRRYVELTYARRLDGLEEMSAPWRRRAAMLIDVDALRDALLELCGTAAFAGFGPALLDVADIEAADAAELLHISERLGVDVSHFAVDDD